jgi:hypothetical protein
MDEEKYYLYRWPFFDPPPPWLKMDDKMQRQFAQMEIKFQLKELELQQQKFQEFAKMAGIV